MAQIPEMATESVDSVQFSFLTTEEVRKYSFKKITEVQLFDELDRPVPNGLYDPALGPALDKSNCRSCGQRPMQCPGHCGHIELVSPIYNPLLFTILLNLLRKICFSCHYFKDEREQVEKCAFQLKLIMKGDIVKASDINVVLQSDYSSLDENNATSVKHATDHSQASNDASKHLKWKNWTSLQYSRAMSILEDFMKARSRKCSRCGFKSPTITQPILGWIEMKISGDTVRRNVIRNSKLVDDADKTFIIGGAYDSNEMSVREIDVDSDDMQSSGAVYDETLDSSGKADNSRVGNLPREFLRQKLSSGTLLPSEVKDHIKLLWDNESPLCSLICDIHQERTCISDRKRSYSMFFIEALLVPPIKFRPITMGGDSVTNHPQTVLYAKVLQSNIDLGYALKNDRSKVVNRWLNLQQIVNVLFGNKKSIGQRDNMGNGICQILEKKEGIFRQKMMGKRVNFSCRSVISPDPYLAVNEIGIPPCFALKLTYPERVTPWNLDKMRNAIINGPDVHPGATHYSDQPGAPSILAANRKKRIAISRKLPSSRGVITQLGKSVEHEHEEKVVYRHLQDGDIVLVNRQPTLHKPSIMAHVVRVLTGERTLRMHYANCSTYNADFDGDEMNVHFPQDEISRAEAFQIVNANNQYIIPTSGDTKRGLIQDHIVAAVLLTKKDTFLSREEYTHLLYSSGVSAAAAARGSFVGKSRRKVSTLISEDEVEMTVPAILKPKPLWTGKQVITSLLNHMTKNEGLPPFTFEAKCTINNQLLTSQSNYGDPPNAKTNDPPFQIRDNDFLDGVIDKAQFGKYGLIHTVQELYGSNTAGILLSGLSRLFTGFLQFHGFTCGVDDLLLKPKVVIRKREQLEDAEKISNKAYCYITNTKDENGGQDSVMVAATPEKIERMKVGIEEKVRVHGDAAISVLDKLMSNAATDIVNAVQEIIFPNKTEGQSKNNSEDNKIDIGLSKAFPRNCFYLMTMSGAKGSQANFSQVSSLLGQQSLEGKRVPIMISGKSLPCFPPWDPALRSGGFITDCFLTGLRPQEYYFHCMAGREGLVDTAVKTSRSGYLQRCLVKNLESLKVGYDRTVRDADGSVVQFLYGGDGVDVHKSSFISKFDTIAHNAKVFSKRNQGQSEDDHTTRPDNFIREDLPENLVDNVEGVLASFSKKQESSIKIVRRKNRKSLKKEKLFNLMMLKYHSSLAQPGEPVGVIAAQSVGEPSTQMTLNTFHHAGQSDANVTLGIPRLQEILMRASEKIQTPIMSCPLLANKTMDDAQRLAEALRKVSVADIVESIEVSVVPYHIENHLASTIYKLKLKLFSPEKYPKDSGITLEACERILSDVFVQELERAIQSHVVMLSRIAGIKNVIQKAETDSESDQATQKSKRKGEEDNESDGEGQGDDLGRDEQKRRERNTDEKDYEDDGENEGEVSGFESEIDQVDPENEGEDETEETEKPKTDVKVVITKKETDRATHTYFHQDDQGKEAYFEVHFKMTNEPHILLSQIAQRAAKNVYIKNLAKIDGCKAIENNKKRPEIRTSGVDFHALWSMQDDLDVDLIECNDIHAILETYGVEAARTTIVKELRKVFETYGISTDFRHLNLIADFMTQTGKYRPMSRLGIADSISPFSKMSFETAGKFIVDAAFHGEVDNLESPSARICLGLPVKMGTGSFDLMQKCRFDS